MAYLVRTRITEELVQHASELAWRHGLRGYLPLASAAAWQQAIGRNGSLCTFDLKVWEAARIIGLFVYKSGVNARKLTHRQTPRPGRPLVCRCTLVDIRGQTVTPAAGSIQQAS